MEEDLARHVVRSVFRAERELAELMSFLKPNMETEEYKGYAKGIATAIDAINVNVLQKVLHVHPQLETEIETSLKKYDRFL